MGGGIYYDDYQCNLFAADLAGGSMATMWSTDVLYAHGLGDVVLLGLREKSLIALETSKGDLLSVDRRTGSYSVIVGTGMEWARARQFADGLVYVWKDSEIAAVDCGGHRVLWRAIMKDKKEWIRDICLWDSLICCLISTQKMVFLSVAAKCSPFSRRKKLPPILSQGTMPPMLVE